MLATLCVISFVAIVLYAKAKQNETKIERIARQLNIPAEDLLV